MPFRALERTTEQVSQSTAAAEAQRAEEADVQQRVEMLEEALRVKDATLEELERALIDRQQTIRRLSVAAGRVIEEREHIAARAGEVRSGAGRGTVGCCRAGQGHTWVRSQWCWGSTQRGISVLTLGGNAPAGAPVCAASGRA